LLDGDSLNKANIVKQLKSKDIAIPSGASVAELQHRLEHWEAGKGYLFRLALPSTRKGDDNPTYLLDYGIVYWIPNSRFARLMAETRLVFIVGRELHPPKGSTMLDVPKDFNDRWGIGVIDGSN
tara:strand:+ start:214 stop:585 length:372 start_codon:yes stop_codon:yes gene_type:complete